MAKTTTATKPKAAAKPKASPETTSENLPATINTNLPAGIDDDLAAEMLANQDQRQVFEAEQLTIPRLALLQDLSPETKQREDTYIEGAVPGLILNKLRRTADGTVLFVPSKFVVRYIAWRPRKDGGGLVDQGLSRQDAEDNFKSDGPGRWVGMMTPREGEEAVKVEVIQTPEWVGFAKSDSFDWMPVAISFPSTKSKVVRDINSTIDLSKMQIGDQRITPAAFYHMFELGSFLDDNGTDKYFNFTATHKGWCTDKQVRNDAKNLKESFDKGDVVVEDAESK